MKSQTEPVILATQREVGGLNAQTWQGNTLLFRHCGKYYSLPRDLTIGGVDTDWGTDWGGWRRGRDTDWGTDKGGGGGGGTLTGEHTGGQGLGLRRRRWNKGWLKLYFC